MLHATEPRDVFIDIDFSSRSTEDDDALLERALADLAPTPVFLAAHFQAATGAGGSLTLTEPLPRFAEHARPASVMLTASWIALSAPTWRC